MKESLEFLKRQGWLPTSIIDIGAYVGDWTRMCRTVFPDAEVLMVEAQQNKIGNLKRACVELGAGVSYELALLGPQTGTNVRFVEMETGSSVFEELSPYKRNYVEKNQVTLDSLIASRGWPNPNFLKLDVQGYELEVLKGGSKAVQHAEVILLESSLLSINKDCPLVFDVLHFMAQSGFRLLDICSLIRRRDGALWQTDLLFLRCDSQLLPSNSLDTSTWW
ncbi:MAG TPA: FkbM family methyltransferase [Pirellulales bacterium]